MSKIKYGYRIKKGSFGWLFIVNGKSKYTIQKGLLSGSWSVREYSPVSQPISNTSTLRDAIVFCLVKEGMV